MLEKIILVVLCHLFGDYVLQSDYIANNKGSDWYILFVHSALYCVPFIAVFGMRDNLLHLLYIFVVHFFTDAMKARVGKIGIWEDQIIHYVAAIAAYVV